MRSLALLEILSINYGAPASAGGASPPLQNLSRCRCRCLLRLLGAGRLVARGLRNAYAFFWRQQRHQDVAFHARPGFDLALVANFHEQAVHLGAPDFLMGHFAPAMENHCAHFVAFAEEPQDLVLANLIIVFRGGGPKLDFLQLRAAAAFALLMSFFVGLVKIFAVVGDLANGRISRGRDFHQVEPSFPGQLHGLKRLHDAQLTTLFINHPDFASPDSFVDANAVALPEAAFCDKSPSSTSLFAAAMRPAGTNSPGSSRGGPNSYPDPHSAKTPGDGLQRIARASGCAAPGQRLQQA